ncbi:unnamed protein product [Rotaria sordida]|uniref:F-box domain-containing protein n=1 Tax=Rotaria sordida TaxID=392033 RepID=A0A814YYM0_9BILA|nr:unnamed protein product [Rotaria sordida]CAF1334819.1 unnamed protein product [Rotaria sordida]CAF1518626.1 unnamed protein product [Rotaria sordida]CAF1593750.1 unnamed protein product [Rotaria sordida]
MNRHTQLEDLSNEIFFEIFDYFHALEIFISFTCLNRRISSILQSIPLRIVILSDHCYRQINFLSSHLANHADQVISLEIFDTICDYTSIISILFNRHNFPNLESCIFVSISSTTILENVFKQIKSLNRLVSFSLYQPNGENINEIDKHNLTNIILLHKSPVLRSISLQFNYDNMHLLNLTSMPSNLVSLKLCISSSSSILPVYSIISMLRLCHSVRYLGIMVTYQAVNENNAINTSTSSKPINYNDLPILSQMISFDLTIFVRCDSRSIASILHCMPHLTHFYFTMAIATWSYPAELLDGYVWQDTLERCVPHLSKFEFHISIIKTNSISDLDIIVNSFAYFVQKYSNWNMIVQRWKFFFGRSVNFNEMNDDNIDVKKSVTYLSHFVHLPNITELEISSKNYDLSRWYDIEIILQSCRNVTNLKINTPLLISSKFIDNPSLFSIFKQIKRITSITEKIYFPSKFALKLVQRFPSLTDIELIVFTFDHCVSIIEVFLCHVEHLSYLKISYSQNTLLDNPFSRHYIIEKRRQIFPNNLLDERTTYVKDNGEAIQIRL